MKNLALFILLMAVIARNSQAQGLIPDPVEFGKLLEAPTMDGSRNFEELPTKVDFTPFMPPIMKQGENDQTCVPLTIAVTAMGVQQAVAANVTDPEQILREYSKSPLYLFGKINGDNCTRGMSIARAVKYLHETGGIPFPMFDATTCADSRLATALKKTYKLAKVKEVQRVFVNQNSDTDIEHAVKLQLVAKRPVVVGIPIDAGFAKVSFANPFYTPTGITDEMQWHAVTVIGYDDQMNAFKLANSHGKNFGENGFFWMRYPDFVAYATEGFIMHLYPETGPGEKTLPAKLGGTFDFKSVTWNQSRLTYNSETPRHVEGGQYELLKKDWKVGQKFQLFAENTEYSEHVCVFSVNSKNEIKIHWPRDINYNEISYGFGESDLVTREDKIVIPGTKTALRISEPGTDFLCILYGNNPIKPELQSILGKIQSGSGSMLLRVHNALGSRLAKGNVTYSPNKMEVTGTPRQGDIVPMLLEVKSQ